MNDTCKIIGEPTEGSLLVLAKKLRENLIFNSREAEMSWTKVLKLEFDRERKSMSILCEGENKIHRLFVKGAPTTLLGRCSHIQSQDGRDVQITQPMRQKIEKTISAMSSRPLRCILLAMKDIRRDDLPHIMTLGKSKEYFTVIEQDLTMIGLIGIKDPVRDDAKESIDMCRKAGIRVIMITGDSQETAIAIARELDLFKEEMNSHQYEENKYIKAFDGKEFFSKECVDQLHLLKTGNIVFSRTEPNDKQKIIQILQSLGEIPAMTGDGVNDGENFLFQN